MRKIPFNLSYFLAHHPEIETRYGHKVRIICTDRKMYGYTPIIGLVRDVNDCCETIREFEKDGRFMGSIDHIYDLFMIVE